MDKPTVRAVHRVILDTDSFGGITFGALDTPVQSFPRGIAVVLDVGDGWWTRESELERVVPSLSRVGHISITGRFVERRGAPGLGIICGLEAIAARLDERLARPPLFESV